MNMIPHWFFSETKTLIRLAIPVSLASAGMSLMSLVSSAVVGRSGSLQLAAYGLSSLIFVILTILAIGLMMGLDPLISQAYGANEPKRARYLLWQGFWLASVASTAVVFLMLVLPLLLEFAGIEPDVAPLVRRCLWIRMPSIPFLLVMYAQRSYLMSAGRTNALTVTTILSNLMNLMLCPVMVLGGNIFPEWTHLSMIAPLGAIGACISNSLSTILVTCMLIFSIKKVSHKDASALHGPSGREMWTAAKVGLPIGLQLFAEMGIFTIIGFLAGRFGKTHLAANQIAVTYASFVFTLAMGVGNAGSVRIGLAIGAFHAKEVKQKGLAALGLGFLLTLGIALLFSLFPSLLTGFMTNQEDIIRATAPLLQFVAIFVVFDGLQGIGSGILRGSGDTKFILYIGLIGHYLIGVPVAVIGSIYSKSGILSLWWGLCAGFLFIALSLIWRFLKISSKPIMRIGVSQPLNESN
jgi:MATE family multidrug resistance protein